MLGLALKGVLTCFDTDEGIVELLPFDEWEEDRRILRIGQAVSPKILKSCLGRVVVVAILAEEVFRLERVAGEW